MSRPGGILVRTLCALALTAVTTLIAPAGNALADAPTPAQHLETFELPSPLVDMSTPGALLPGGRTVPKVNVLLPGGYDADPDRAYPVLWLLHGANGGADTWASGIEELAAGLPAIIVGHRHRHVGTGRHRARRSTTRRGDRDRLERVSKLGDRVGGVSGDVVDSALVAGRADLSDGSTPNP
jgi:hypothetical protein